MKSTPAVIFRDALHYFRPYLSYINHYNAFAEARIILYLLTDKFMFFLDRFSNPNDSISFIIGYTACQIRQRLSTEGNQVLILVPAAPDNASIFFPCSR